MCERGGDKVNLLGGGFALTKKEALVFPQCRHSLNVRRPPLTNP